MQQHEKSVRGAPCVSAERVQCSQTTSYLREDVQFDGSRQSPCDRKTKCCVENRLRGRLIRRIFYRCCIRSFFYGECVHEENIMRVGIKPIVKKRHALFQGASCRPNTELSAGSRWPAFFGRITHYTETGNRVCEQDRFQKPHVGGAVQSAAIVS